ncbi:MAG: 3-deoxy-manno-octulosonate cytidylyltransferase [Candidatus Omnitrophica bacterium]|nr:3-deoxy-manno-octulosonate cytidylyltransferase [Candidatus Omnitrophota bacterium]
MKIGLLITARLKSKRLPMKILKDLNGRTVIERIIDRAKVVKGVSDIVLCTSTNPQDRPLVDIAAKNGIYYFAGSEEDVLNRMFSAAKLFNMDFIISVTADNPLFSIYHAELAIKEAKKGKYDYIKIEGLPIGGICYGLKNKALEVVCRVKEVIDTEIWGHLFNQPRVFDVCVLPAKGKYRHPNIRLTLDYKEDYRFLKRLHREIKFTGVLSLGKVIDYLDENPRLLKINNKCVQRKLTPGIKEKIDRFYSRNLKTISGIKKRIYKGEA